MIIDYQGVQNLRPLLLRFRSKSSSFNVKKIESGEYKGKVLIKFSVMKDHYGAIVQKLEAQKIKILHDSDDLKNNIKEHLAESPNEVDEEYPEEEIEDIKHYIPSIDVEKLDTMLKNGKTEEVFGHSKSIIEQGNELINGVNSILEKATFNVINSEKEKVKVDATHKKDCLSKIMSIAADQSIHAINDSNLSEVAGDEAINICLDDREFTSELIQICNNVNIHSRINLKAAIRFAETVFEEQDDYSKELELATESLNLLWLNFAHEVFHKDFTPIEIGSYNRLISYISSNREK